MTSAFQVSALTTPVTGRSTFDCQEVSARSVPALKTPVTTTFDSVVAAFSARCTRRTPLPVEPNFKTSRGPVASSDIQVGRHQTGVTSMPRLRCHAAAASCTGSS
ncbi:unannotated protein [freshwater metagenome]|uniref:Unannotated protein n=1 Tax=freshwater metagenome TaxID=449393 RepID=A0A6J6NW86_9ZZZZ